MKGEDMREYDVIVIGSGAGLIIVESALANGYRVALVDKGPLGGTCLNLGCIPSKMLIYPADRAAEIMESEKLGILAEIKKIDFESIMKRMRGVVQKSREHIHKGLKNMKNLDFYEKEAFFVEDYTLQVGAEQIKGKKIFIAAGARVAVPPIKGIDQADYLTNESVLKLTKKPESIVIIGGGYIAVEYGHFFSSMGTDVTILQRDSRLMPGVDPEISDLLRSEMEKRMKIVTDIEATRIEAVDEGVRISARNRKTGKEKKFKAEKVMVATGRASNADILKVEKTGVKTDERGYVQVNEYLETTKKGIWAIGDANGKQMFRHVANVEADVAWHNSMHGNKTKMDYSAAPYAVFTHPQIAGVGMSEAQAREKYSVLIGKARYNEVAKGDAMREEEAFAKAIVDKETLEILGFHIIGPYAPILIQEVVNAMANKEDIYSIGRAMHIHPALPELIVTTLGNLTES